MVTARSISPGDEGALQITFDGKSRSGKMEKTVRMTTNDPEKETVVFTIRAFIRSALILEPKVALVGPLGPDEERVVRLQLHVDDAENVSVSRISSTVSWINGRIVDDPEGDGGRILEVHVVAGPARGKFQETLTLHTTSREKPKIDIPVTGILLDKR